MEITNQATQAPVFVFESIGFVDTRETFDSLVETDTALLWAAVKDRAATLGFTEVVSVSCSEDDEQGDDDIKVFVSVSLRGICACEENESAPDDLVLLLDQLAQAVCCDETGADVVNSEDWELLSIDED